MPLQKLAPDLLIRNGTHRRALFLVAVIVLVGTTPAAASSPRRTLSLDGPEWKLSGFAIGEGERNRIQEHPFAAATATTVPNDVQLAIGLKDPFGQGPELSEINRKEWWYTRSFHAPLVRHGEQVRLLFDGVDYFADVWLNGQLLGSHEGAYTAFAFDVTEKLRAGSENYLAVRVRAPWKVPGRSHYEFMKGEFEEWWDALPGTGQVVFPLGLHRSVRLEISGAVRVEELRVWTAGVSDRGADLLSTLVLSSRSFSGPITVQLALRPENFEGPPVELGSRTIELGGRAREQTGVEFSGTVSNPRLWWTWDMGPQNLYRVEATVTSADGHIIDSSSALFGIRTLERGSDILYRINGRPVFLRGAWYAMSKLYPGSTDRWTYEKDLRLARNANMNHLVNYTVVERDDFYELADRLGILLFVELPFNQEGPIDALHPAYPRRNEFMRWAAAESGQIVRALSNHPSVGVWSAISEVTTNGQDFGVSWDWRIAEAAGGYDAFVKLMEKVVRDNDPDALYFRSYCDFGERHFWNGAIFPGTTYDQHFDAEAPFVSEYGALGFFPPEDAQRVLDARDVWDERSHFPSAFSLPFKTSAMSYIHPWQYTGMDFLSAELGVHVNRNIRSFREYAEAANWYQAFLYGYAADAYRRKLFAPINGIRSWMLKSFPEKPAGGFGVIDAFDVPLPSYYVQKRTFAPVSMSWARRYALESVSAGSPLAFPIWVSNAGASELVDIAVESELLNLRGEVVRNFAATASVPPSKAVRVADLNWVAPDLVGVYVLRGRLRHGGRTLAENRGFVKISPPVTRTPVRVLLLGSPEWAQPTEDYLRNLGADVQAIVYEATDVRPVTTFPATAEEVRRRFDVIWLAGFDNYWREAPDGWSHVITEAVKSGVAFVHTGSPASFHGGGEKTAALELSELAAILPVRVRASNDAVLPSIWKVGSQDNPYAVKSQTAVSATGAAPAWLRDCDFVNLSPKGYHTLEEGPDARVLLRLGELPLLVGGRYGQGRTFAYLGFSPQGQPKISSDRMSPDRMIVASAEHRLFAMVAASLLALASGQDPTIPIGRLLEARAIPLFEMLGGGTPNTAWPKIEATWIQPEKLAHIRVTNGPDYAHGFRLRLQGAGVANGDVLELWTNQFFDLLPGEIADCDVEVRTRDGAFSGPLTLIGELNGRTEMEHYEFTADRSARN